MIGIGGVGMAALAVLLKNLGNDVSGCDLRSTPRTKWLESLGIKVFIGHDRSHLDGVDEVVVTPAVEPSMPEFAEASSRAIEISSRGEVLARIVSGCDSIAVCGSHGKTTTATWIAKLLNALGEDVSWAIGGECGDFPVAGVGTGPLVVEADESDGTLSLYSSGMLVVNKIEYDHPDHFKSMQEYSRCFDTAKANAREVVDAEALDLDGWCFPVAGEHNVRNARAAVEVALRRGHSRERILSCLSEAFSRLPDRRFELLAAGVYTDYAHHPTEMKCAVSMARSVCQGKLRVLFQPHRYSRTKALLNDFPPAFAGADEIVVCPTYSAFETAVEGGDEADLYAVCRSAGLPVLLARSCSEAWEHAANSMGEGDVTLLLGAGDIIDLAGQVRKDRNAGRSTLPMRRIWIGHGTNTWKSDLCLNVEYVRTAGPAGRSGASLKIPWMAGIPGTVGGWIKMNAGAFGHSFGELVERVKVDGRWLDVSECGFSYRHSEIRGEIQDVVLRSCGFDCAEGDFIAKRLKFPAGTYGSFFKNPPGLFAGALLEESGAKTMNVGGAYVWSDHANVIVRGEGASASDVLALSRLMRNRVFAKFAVKLEAEVSGIEPGPDGFW